ncbi:Caleosin-domain-containing protein [Acephala macrosclerotiorum]|nr:Caleosin-domain-containing protein [Acephala macrosclerotiorum]
MIFLLQLSSLLLFLLSFIDSVAQTVTMALARTEEEGFAVSIPEVPVTEQRGPFIEKEGDRKLKNPGTARANEAATTEAPHGATKNGRERDYKHQTVLQQHLSYFDRDGDGVIWPKDTFIGFYRLGYGLILSIISVLIIHPGFSWPTLSGWLPDPFFRIYIARIHKDKHGSDSGSYDTEGRLVPQKFEDIFSKYASGDKKGITLKEMFTYMKGQRLVMDPFGWSTALFEWGATYLLLWPKDGRMKKEDIRGIYDGSLFFEIAARREKKKQ